MSSKTKISIVTSGRNDNYGGDFYQRLQHQVNWIAHWGEQFRLPIEYLLVNYNPLPDQPSLKEAINWPGGRDFVQFSLLTVPGELHADFINPEIRKTVPLFEFIAKNAGIRRASSDFILTTNADILLDPGLLEQIAKRELDSGQYYRAERCDFWGKEAMNSVDLDSMREMVRASAFKFFMRGVIYHWDGQKLKAPGKFITGRFTRAYAEAKKLFLDENSGFQARLEALRELNAIQQRRLGRLYKLQERIKRLGYSKDYITPEVFLHCNASGDFLMMAGEAWKSLRGFPEDTYISTHTDSLMVFKASSAGLEESVFQAPVYHQEHERRFDFSTRNDAMEGMYQRLQKDIQSMKKLKGPLIVNGPDWGLRDVNLNLEVF